MKTTKIDPGSFRDPSGVVFEQNGIIYRNIHNRYKDRYDHFMSSGLYQKLVEKGLLIPHIEVDASRDPDVYKTIQPERIPFISYPYEWSFNHLKDAALLTLRIHKIAIKHGMILKDASAYNVQYYNGRPIFIDTLSFDFFEEKPWVAYRQFCQHFLAPLALMSKIDIRLNQLLKIYIDGIPLDLASRLLGFRSRFRLSILFHIHLHASSQKRHADNSTKLARYSHMSKLAHIGLSDSLRSSVKKLKFKVNKSEWSHYYSETNYSQKSFKHKCEIVSELLDIIKPKTVFDMGANIGLFSRIASGKKAMTVSLESDPNAVELNYLKQREEKDPYLLPLVMDLTNPSPGIGWVNMERRALLERGPADTVLALALIHHLAISNNGPLSHIASFFSQIGSTLIIEFVPKSDSQVQRLLSTREDIFSSYSISEFESAFEAFYKIIKRLPVLDSERTIFYMEKKQ